MRSRLALLLAMQLVLAEGTAAVETEAPADRVLRGGRIYTVDPAQPWAEAVAIRGRRFLRVGSLADVAAVTGPDTRILELEGRLVLPGLVDLHVLPFTGALFGRLSLRFTNPYSVDSMLEELRQYARAHPEKEWIRGASWGVGVFPDDQPRRETLDAVVAQRPVVLIDETGLSYWVNSKALELAGIDAKTEAPPGYLIERDPESGEPTGTLRKGAQRLVERVASQPTLDEWIWIERQILYEFARHGVTSMQSAEGRAEWLKALAVLEKRGAIPVRVFVAWDWRTHRITPHTDAEMEAQIEAREAYTTRKIRPNYVKIFADDTPIDRSSGFVDPYSDDPSDWGRMNLPPHELQQAVISFDRRGIGCVIHSVGDGTSRAALDAIEAAREANPESRVRHRLAHAAWIHRDDLRRFTRIRDVAVEFSPGLLMPQPGVAETLVRLLGADRYGRIWPVRSLLSTGARVGYGSDWPARGRIDPWLELQTFVTRRNPRHPELGVLGERERVSVAEAVEIFTINGAWALGAETEIGSIAEGKLADLIVVSQDLFELEREGRLDRIRDTEIVKTLFDGEIVYDAEAAQGVWRVR